MIHLQVEVAQQRSELVGADAAVAPQRLVPLERALQTVSGPSLLHLRQQSRCVLVYEWSCLCGSW